MSFRSASLAALLAFGLSAPPASAQAADLAVGTGNLGGLYYPVGGAVAALWQAHVDGVDAGVESTGGAIENLWRVASGDLSLGIARSDLVNDALLGYGAFAEGEPLGELRLLFALYPEPVTVIARADAGIASFADLAGKRLNLGPVDSASRSMLDLVLAAWEWTEADFDALSELPVDQQMAALCDGEVDAVAFVAAHPTGTIADALRACETVLVPIVGEPVEKLLQAHPFLAPTVISAGLYEGQNEDVVTVGPVAVVVAGSSLPNDMSYRLARAAIENLDQLKEAHPVLMRLDPLSMTGQGLGLPLHPGADRYFDEADLLHD